MSPLIGGLVLDWLGGPAVFWWFCFVSGWCFVIASVAGYGVLTLVSLAKTTACRAIKMPYDSSYS